MPLRTLAASNCSRRLSFLTTSTGSISIFSYVVKRLLHSSHSRRRRIAPSSVGRESTTRLSVQLQYMHFMSIYPSVLKIFAFFHSLIIPAFRKKVNPFQQLPGETRITSSPMQAICRHGISIWLFSPRRNAAAPRADDQAERLPRRRVERHVARAPDHPSVADADDILLLQFRKRHCSFRLSCPRLCALRPNITARRGEYFSFRPPS